MTWSVSNESAPVRRAPAKRARACPTESQEQKSLFKWWCVYSRHAPHLVMYHIPNGGRRDAITGARLKAEGVVAGVPDIFLAVPRQGFHGLYVELKRQKGGSLESSQEDIIARLRQAGYRVEVCKGWTAAREVIENYLGGSMSGIGECDSGLTWNGFPVVNGKVGQGVKIERIRRITGYLVGTVDRFNDAKRAEVRDRVKHVRMDACGGDRETA